MRGRPPKPADQRRNRSATRHDVVVLPAEGRKGRIPTLPKDAGGVTFSEETRAWWTEVWHSPPATQWRDFDRHSLIILAILLEKFTEDPKPTLAAEIRVRMNQWGLTPEGRRALRWTIGEPVEPEAKPDEVRAARLRRIVAVDPEGEAQ